MEALEMWLWRRMEKISWRENIKNDQGTQESRRREDNDGNYN
jgi:hypothetical protein